MKASLCSIAALSLLAAGCEKPSGSAPAATNTASTNSSVITAPVDYLGAVARGQQTAIKTIDTTSIDKAIQLFQVDKGRNPKDLNELVEEHYLPQIPKAPYGTTLQYDPNSGTVKVVKQ